tara:strand:+ start:211 stop:1164 length:954 start_codon:yes stop_codon:yes gene_type:complete
MNLKLFLSKKLTNNNCVFDKIIFLAGDASNRKYFRLHNKNSCDVVMYDNSKDNSIENFINKTRILEKFKLRVPRIYKKFISDGILIIEDFGDNKYSKILNKKNEEELYLLAIDSLIHLHDLKDNFDLEFYDKKKLFSEVSLFFKWFLPLNKKSINSKEKKTIINYLDPLFDILNGSKNVLVHRDYHVDNLFYLINQEGTKKCGWIDYQDALIGPAVYDLMSLLEDARRKISINLKNKLINYYIKKAKIKQKDLFHLTFKIMAIQRHLKVLGVFSRLCTRDNMPQYKIHLPRVKKYLISNFEDEYLQDLGEIIIPLLK